MGRNRIGDTLSFADVDGIPADCGVYEIHTDDGFALKVGIGANLRRRLVRHKMSRDSGLRVKVNGDRNHPDHVESKSSVLAKHLYYDRSLTADYDLKTQAGRRAFLMERCHILIERVPTLLFARDIERSRERTGSFRYVGRVVIR